MILTARSADKGNHFQPPPPLPAKRRAGHIDDFAVADVEANDVHPKLNQADLDEYRTLNPKGTGRGAKGWNWQYAKEIWGDDYNKCSEKGKRERVLKVLFGLLDDNSDAVDLTKLHRYRNTQQGLADAAERFDKLVKLATKYDIDISNNRAMQNAGKAFLDAGLIEAKEVKGKKALKWTKKAGKLAGKAAGVLGTIAVIAMAGGPKEALAEELGITTDHLDSIVEDFINEGKLPGLQVNPAAICPSSKTAVFEDGTAVKQGEAIYADRLHPESGERQYGTSSVLGIYPTGVDGMYRIVIDDGSDKGFMITVDGGPRWGVDGFVPPGGWKDGFNPLKPVRPFHSYGD